MRERTLRGIGAAATRLFLLYMAVLLGLIVAWLTDVPVPDHSPLLLVLIGFVIWGTSVLCTWSADRMAVRREPSTPVEVAPPVRGAWQALNGPADKVPSHGVRSLGQAYAIDVLVVEGREDASSWSPIGRPAAAYPSFGEPLLAVADATVVHVDDGQRDHRGRDTYPGLAYLVLEGLVRSLGGPRRILGNHVILDLGDGVHALYAHLRRGSASVRVGDRVMEGTPIGLCGNSGNSSEPHLHFQLMDDADPKWAAGLPFTWTGVGLPPNGEVFTVPATGNGADATGS